MERRQTGNVQYRLRQNQTVGRHGQNIRRKGGKFSYRPAIPEVFRLPYRQTQRLRRLLDRAGLQLVPAPSRSVRLGVDRNDLPIRPVRQTAQYRGRQFRRAHEDYPADFLFRHFLILVS